MIDLFKQAMLSQFEAALCMLGDCIQNCPPEHWDGSIAKYPFWQVAYHTLCFVDLYLSPNEESFEPREIHPTGWDEFNNEYPSRQFTQAELSNYLQICRAKAISAIDAETSESLSGESGFARRTFSRAEMHIYNLRHLQHHTGQLSAFLRRVESEISPRWVGSGWN